MTSVGRIQAELRAIIRLRQSRTRAFSSAYKLPPLPQKLVLNTTNQFTTHRRYSLNEYLSLADKQRPSSAIWSHRLAMSSVTSALEVTLTSVNTGTPRDTTPDVCVRSRLRWVDAFGSALIRARSFLGMLIELKSVLQPRPGGEQR